jgi:hypothetical protein
MRTIGAGVAVGVLTAILHAPPAAAFGLRIGPLHLGLPFPGHFHRSAPRPPIALHPSGRRQAALFDKADLGTNEPMPGATPAPLYPGVALPTLYEAIFRPASASAWPFGYEAIFRTAFAKSRPELDAQACQQSNAADAIAARIKAEVKPTAAQMPLLQKLVRALRMTSGYLAKSCPSEIPAQPVVRLQLMQAQIQALTLALDIIRPPLQQFEQSLNARQRARFAGTRTASANRWDCGAASTATDRSITQIDQSVQPTADQRGALADLKTVLAGAANDLEVHCTAAMPAMPLARLEATEARLDASWRAVLSMQVALANFETRLSDQQRLRLESADLAAAQ